MATTKTTAQEAVKKSATVKPATKPAVKKTVHAVTPTIMLALGSAFASIMNRAYAYHGALGRIELTPDGYRLTAEGKKFFSARTDATDLAEAQKLSAHGGKTRGGRAYIKAGSEAPYPYRYPWDGTKGESGRDDSRAAFAHIMLTVSGK